MIHGVIHWAVELKIKQHGSLRAAARVLNIDPGYLLRLKNREKKNPGAAILRKLGIRKVVTTEYQWIRTPPREGEAR